jgi:hypothetical protein
MALAGQSPPAERDELRRLVPYAQASCEPIYGDQEAFRRAVLPYAPLSMTVSRTSAGESRALRNIFLGIAGRACGVDSAALAASFAGGAGCVGRRRADLVSKLSRVRAAVDAIRPLTGIKVLAQWGGQPNSE